MRSTVLVRLLTFLLALALPAALAAPEIPEAQVAQPIGVLVSAGQMSTERGAHTATLLPDGRVLVAGGMTREYKRLATAELYDPATQTFTLTGSMSVPRSGHTATLLPNGKVLIAGGGDGQRAHSICELYDPENGIFASAGTLRVARQNHTATMLPNGKVLIAGGATVEHPVATAELYDPGTGTFSFSNGRMSTPRTHHTATLLARGHVLITGGDDGTAVLNSAELYNAATDSFVPAGEMSAPRQMHTATVLTDGKVLVAGGVTPGLRGGRLFSFLGRSGRIQWFEGGKWQERKMDYFTGVELYDPASGTFSPAGHLTLPREEHAAARLPDGKVLLAGPDSTAEVYDPASHTSTLVSGTLGREVYRSATLVLPDGRAILVGGYEPLSGKLVIVGGQSYIAVPENARTRGRLGDPRSGVLRTTAKLYRPCSQLQTSPLGTREEAQQLHQVKRIYVGRVDSDFVPYFASLLNHWAEWEGIELVCTEAEADATMRWRVSTVFQTASYEGREQSGPEAGQPYTYTADERTEQVRVEFLNPRTGNTIWKTKKMGADALYKLTEQLQRDWEKSVKKARPKR